MKRSIQNGLLEVQLLETDQWPFPIHTRNHFELILIRAGSGHHIINGNGFAYKAGDVFFLGPLDAHYFTIDKKTRFCLLSFTELYMAGLSPTRTDSWPQIRESGFTKSQSFVGSIATKNSEQQSLNALVDIVLAEQATHEPLFANPIVESLMKTILSLVDRHLTHHQLRVGASDSTASSLVQQMSTYVCHHITRPDFLRMEKMADVFHYSQSHLSALFKQQTGESIQQYIIRYKLQLVKTRLTMSTMNISQIADELGFTDVCHLNKLFKRHYQRTPTDYRRALAKYPV